MSKDKIMVLSCHTHSLFWFRMDMMRYFLQAGYEVVAVGQEPEEQWIKPFEEVGIRYRQLYAERNGTNPLKDLKTLKSIRKLLDEEKPSKIFCYQAKTVIYGCIAAHSRELTEVYPLIAGLGSVFRGEGLKNSILRMVLSLEYRVALRYAKAVIFQNPDDMGCFVQEKIVKRDKCRMIHGSGVDTAKFQPTDHPDTPAFLMIARLIRDKGIGEYLDACRIIRQKHPHVRCLLVGPFDTNPSAISPEALRAYTEDGSVEYFGEQSDVRPYLQQASVFVLPSYHEGTPKTVLEAMAAGRAILTTDAPGCRETVADGVNGYLIPVKDTPALVDAMERLLHAPDLCKQMGIAGRELAETKYDVRKINSAIAEIMQLTKMEELTHVSV